jgi:hypothetical protein
MKFEKGDIVLKTKTGVGRAQVVESNSLLEGRIMRSIRDALGVETTAAIHKHAFIFVRDKIVHFADQNGRVHIRTWLGFDPKKPASRATARVLSVEGDAEGVSRVVDRLAGAYGATLEAAAKKADEIVDAVAPESPRAPDRLLRSPFFDADEAVSPRGRPGIGDVEVAVDPYSMANIAEELRLSYNLGRALEHFVLGRASSPGGSRRNHYRKAMELVAMEIESDHPSRVRRAMHDVVALREKNAELSRFEVERNGAFADLKHVRGELDITKHNLRAADSRVERLEADLEVAKQVARAAVRLKKGKKPARSKRAK